MNNATDNQAGQEAAANPQRNREMPLLFQLADASWQPPVAIPVTPPAPIEQPKPSTFPLASTVLEPTLSSRPRTTSSLFEMPAGLSTAARALGSTVQQEPKPIASPAVPVVTESALTEKAIAPPIVSSGLPAAIDSAVKAAAEITTAVEVKAGFQLEAKTESPPAKAEIKADAAPPKTEASPASPKTTRPVVETVIKPAVAEADKPSPASLRRQRAEARQAQVEGKESDWLQSHGKVIAICFVLALVGTVYLARRNRGAAPPPAIDTPNLAIEIPGDDSHGPAPAKPIEAANTAPRLVEAPSHPLDTTPSPATPMETTPVATSTAELQPPVVPNAGQTTAPPASEPLFPWQTESRVATRPDAANPAVPPASNNSPTTASPAPPALNAPTYPETNLRDAPLLPPAPPATAPGNSPAAGQGRSSGRVPASFSPASFTSAPGGNRYERTGSGLY